MPILKWPSDKIPTFWHWVRPLKQKPSLQHHLGQITSIPPCCGGGDEIKAQRDLQRPAASTPKPRCARYLQGKQQLLPAETREAHTAYIFSRGGVNCFSIFCPVLFFIALQFLSSQTCSQTCKRQTPAARQRSSEVPQVSPEERPLSQGATRQSGTYRKSEHQEPAGCKQY